MEPLLTEKRVISALLPYRKRSDGRYEYYLQKRTETARINPGLFGMFGGHAEDAETPEETLFREISEELAYTPRRHRYLSRYEFGKFIFHVFIEEVDETFESKVEVHEGDFGTFMTLEETKASDKMSPRLPVVLPDIEDMLTT